MHRHTAPDGHVVGLVGERQQVGTFDLFERDQRDLASATVHAATGDLQAPGFSLTSRVGQIAEVAAFSEALAHVADGPLHMRLHVRRQLPAVAAIRDDSV